MPTPSSAARAVRTVDDALARAVVCQAISRAFVRPGDGIQSAAGDGRRSALGTAIERLGLPRLEDGGLSGSPDAFDDLFGHTARGRVCPYETEYGKLYVFRQAQELADIQGCYTAFGLARRRDRHERVDHIGVEFEFLGFLAQKEAWALDADEREQVEVARIAYRVFLRDHLGRFGLAVTTQLIRADPRGPYGLLGALAGAFLRSECARLRVPAGPATLPLRADEPDDAPMACDAGDGECVPGGEGTRDARSWQPLRGPTRRHRERGDVG